MRSLMPVRKLIATRHPLDTDEVLRSLPDRQIFIMEVVIAALTEEGPDIVK